MSHAESFDNGSLRASLDGRDARKLRKMRSSLHGKRNLMAQVLLPGDRFNSFKEGVEIASGNLGNLDQNSIRRPQPQVGFQDSGKITTKTDSAGAGDFRLEAQLLQFPGSDRLEAEGGGGQQWKRAGIVHAEDFYQGRWGNLSWYAVGRGFRMRGEIRGGTNFAVSLRQNATLSR